MLQDLRYGLRTLAKSPSFTVVSLVALTLGIAATTQSFSIVNTVLIKPLPYKESERLVAIWQATPTQDREFVSPADFLDWRTESLAFESVAASRAWLVNITGHGESEHVRGYLVSANFFQTLGMEAALGRTFRPNEDQIGEDRVVVLSHRLWTRRFGSDPSVIDRNVVLNNESYLVVGVMPADFRYPRGAAELWAPLAFSNEQMQDRKSHFLLVTGRVKSGVSLEQAKTDISRVAERLQHQYPETNAGRTAWLLPLRELILGPAAQDLVTALVAAILVLVIACANVSSMLLARSAARQKEVAIRIAVGARRVRLIRQLLTEGLVLALVGGSMGVLLAHWGIKALIANIPTFISDVNPRMLEIKIDGEAVLFTLGLSFLAVVMFGLAPALLASRPDVNSMLKEGARSSTGGIGRHRVRSLLVVTEMALAVVLLVGAGLLFRSYVRVLSVSPGFDAQRMLTMDVPLTRSKYPDGRKVATFYQDVLRGIETLPGVEAAAAVSDLPLAGGDNLKVVNAEGQPVPLPGREQRAHYRVVSPKYFQAQGLPLIQGHDFDDDDFENKPPVAIISESLAKRFWPGGDAVGKRLSLEDESSLRQVIAIVGDVKDWDLLNKSSLYVYVPYPLNEPEHFMTLVVRTNSDLGRLVPAVRGKLSEIDGDQPVANVKTMEKVISDTRSPQRINMIGLAILASTSTILAAIGIYGLISYSVAQGTREIGMRIALGAGPSDIVSMVVRQGMKLVLAGLLAGLAGALLLTRGMAALLYGISLIDPLTYASIPALLVTIAMLAIYVPARRASRVEAMAALRCE